jgi:hypothetical protein
MPNYLASYWSFEKVQCKQTLQHFIKKEYDKYEGATRLAMSCGLKSKLSKQKTLFLKSATNERENLTASCEVCLEFFS